jgi:hypothetical protein
MHPLANPLLNRYTHRVLRRKNQLVANLRKTPTHMSRPKKAIDPDLVLQMALAGCSTRSMARYLGVSHDTLERRYRDVIEQGRGDGEVRLRVKAYQMAISGNSRLMELELINRCGLVLKPETVINVTQHTAPPPGTPIPITEAVKAKLVEMSKLIREEAAREQAQLGRQPPP